jgi:hypothetical protein
MQVQNQKFEIEALKAHPVNPYQSITDTKIEPTVVSFTCPVKEYFEDEPQAEELHEILQSNASPAKELTLTEDEIDDVWAACSTGESDTIDMHLFAEAILRKAQSNCNGFCGEYECKENQSICKRKANEK